MAIEVEKQRRFSTAAQQCPISRQEYELLFEHVADHIVESGHQHDYSITSDYLHAQGMPVEPLMAFLSEHKISDDWSFFIGGDPHVLFGPTTDRLVRMPIEKDALNDLLHWMEARVATSGCDHTHRLTREWLSDHEYSETKVIGGLDGTGRFLRL